MPLLAWLSRASILLELEELRRLPLFPFFIHDHTGLSVLGELQNSECATAFALSPSLPAIAA